MIDWESPESEYLLNPATPLAQKVALESVRGQLPSLPGCVLVLTSGTTAVSPGEPKWVVLKKSAVLDGAHAANQLLQSNSSDLWLHALPEFHIGGIAIRARAYLSMARVERLSFAKGWDPARFRKSVIELHASLSSLVPAQVHDLVRLGLKAPPSLRAILVGGGALAPSLYSEARALGWPLLPTYGMSEAASQVATAELSTLENPGVEAPAFPKLRVLEHLEARSNAEGRIELRGASLFEGYLVLRGGRWELQDPKRDGWFTTEDLGTVADGCLTVGGRLSDRIKIGGESVDLFRLRMVLEEEKTRLRVSEDLAIVPVTDERLENVIELVRTGSSDQDSVVRLIEAFNDRVFPFEKIRSVRMVKKIPRTALGKLKASSLERRP